MSDTTPGSEITADNVVPMPPLTSISGEVGKGASAGTIGGNKGVGNQDEVCEPSTKNVDNKDEESK